MLPLWQRIHGKQFKQLKRLNAEWQKADYSETTEALFTEIENSFTSDHQDNQLKDIGDVDDVLESNEIIEAEYRVPYLAHATMEPMGAVAWYRNGKLDIWAGTQAPTQARTDAAKVAGLDES